MLTFKTMNLKNSVSMSLEKLFWKLAANLDLNVSIFYKLSIEAFSISILLILVKRPAEGSTVGDFHSSAKRCKELEADPLIEKEISSDSKITHYNQPIQVEVYQDPVTENEKVVIVASLPGGASDAEFTLVGSGPGTTLARFTYKWPPMSFRFEELFKKSIEDGSIQSYHPKIVALKKGLRNCRDSIDDIPVGVIDIELPIPVLTLENSISRNGRKSVDGSLLMVIELMAYESAYTIKPSSKKIVFEEEQAPVLSIKENPV